jgi:hypothetical protein
MVDGKASLAAAEAGKMPKQINAALTATRVRQEKKSGRYSSTEGLTHPD